jgi:uncharacterized protein
VQKVIDAHIHLSERRDDALIPFARRNGLRYTLAELLRNMRRHNVAHGLLLSPPIKGWAPLPNAEVVRLCERSNGMLSPVITVEPSKNEVIAAVRQAEKSRNNFKGFKIRLGYHKAFAYDPVFSDVYDYAEAEGLPVLFHTGDTASSNGDLAYSHPLTIDRLANEREELAIVICHFGNPWFEDVAELIYKHPKVYTDMSGLTTGGGGYAKKFGDWLARKVSEAAYYAGGAEKIIFGTDYPITKYSDALALVKMLELSDADKERILWRNAKELFRL